MTELPTWFGPPGRPLFGWFSVPESGHASLGVVLCPPMTEEARATHRTFRTLGERLAAQGILALRLDYRGTGDSAGLLTDPDLVSQWHADLRHATDLLRQSGVRRVAAVGMRLGATIAASCVDDLELSDLVLWDPCVSGTSFLREGEALHAMRTDPTAVFGHAVPEGAVDTPGFRFGRSLVVDMAQLNVGRLAAAKRPPARTLVLTRDDRPAPAGLRRVLAGEGAIWATAHGQAELLDVLPSSAAVPERTVDDIVGWLSESPDVEPVRLDIRPQLDADVCATDGTVVTERVTRWTDIGLFGMLTQPRAAADTRSPLPWLLFLNVASEHHIGPGRQWVELARDWSALGYRCVRLDQSGIGDSPTRPGQRQNVTFAPSWLDDAPAVVDELAADGSPVIVVGLCSGAHSAMEAALVTRVEAILAVNVRMSLPQMAKGCELYDPRRKAARAPIGIIGRLAMRHRKLGGGVWRVYRQFAWWHAPLSAVAQVVATGTEFVTIANPVDAREFSEVVLWTAIGRRRLARNPRYRRIVDPAVDHSLLTEHGQRTVRQTFTRFLLDRYGSQSAPAVSAEPGESSAMAPIELAAR